MRIVNPTFGVSAAAGANVALKPVNWKTDAIALVSNSKPNARELLDGVRTKLGAFRSVDNIDFLAKNSASQRRPQGPAREGRRQLPGSAARHSGLRKLFIVEFPRQHRTREARHHGLRDRH